MSTFNRDILEWINYDNTIKAKNDNIKDLRLKRDNLEISILQHIKENNMEDNVFNITSMNTQLKVNKTNTKETISYKFLEITLMKYFNNETKTKELLDFIKNNRNCVEKINLRRN